MARILTPDEVNALPTYKTQWMEFRLRYKDELYRMVFLEGHRAKNLMNEYGKTWRVWSEKPTDDEREKVKWDE